MTRPPDPSKNTVISTVLASFRQGKQKSRLLLGALSLVLAWYALQGVAWTSVWHLLIGIGPLGILIIVIINLLILPLMAARWWLLLKTLGGPVSLLLACSYRTAASAISYLTPGPLFGGEPLAIYLLYKRHGISLPTATTSVAVDRLLELLASFIVLLFCLSAQTFTASGLLPGSRGLLGLIVLLTGLTCLLAALFTGARPFSRALVLANTLCRRFFPLIAGKTWSLTQHIAQGEDMAESLLRKHRPSFLLANLLSLAQWLAIFTEFWLMAFFLGFPLSFGQLTAVVVVARLAFFTPLPAGIGVLESALPWVTTVLGMGHAFGMGLCLIIRFRDLVVNGAGLVLTLKYLTQQRKIATLSGTTYAE